MLTALRSKASSWIVKILFAVLIATFGVWGISDVLRMRSATPPLVDIGPVHISAEQFKHDYDKFVKSLQPQFGGKLDADLARQLGLHQRALQDLVNRTLLDVEPQRMQLVMPDSIIRQQIEASPAFKDELGNFDRNRFAVYLDTQQMNEAAFVDTLRQDIVRNQLLAAIAGGSAVPKALANAIYGYRDEKRVAATIFVANGAITDVGQPDEKTLAEFHKQNASRYQSPEFRAVTLVWLRPEDVAGDVSVSEQEIADDFNARSSEFDTPEK